MTTQNGTAEAVQADKSIQARDDGVPYSAEPYIGDMFFLRWQDRGNEIHPWSYWPHWGDRQLRNFWKGEPHIAGAIYSMTARIKSLFYNIVGEDEEIARDLLEVSDLGRGLMSLVSKTVQDFLTQDNGFFWELEGPGNAASVLMGTPTRINYLDPAQCYRTFDPDYPVIYINPVTATVHRMHRTRVVFSSSMPQPNEMARNVGFCALRRLFKYVAYIRDTLTYRYEKVSGKFKRGIIHGSGTTARTLEAAMAIDDAANEAAGVISIGGIPVIISPKGVDLKLLELASLPDAFDPTKETSLYIYAMAMAFGVDAREFWPATTTGATKSDADIQHLKATGKGLADLISTLEGAINTAFNGLDAVFNYDFVDNELDKQEIAIAKERLEVLSTLKKDGTIDKKTYFAIAVSQSIIPKEALDNIDEIFAELPQAIRDMLEEDEIVPPANPLMQQPGTLPQADEIEEDQEDVERGERGFFTEGLKTVDEYISSYRQLVRGLWTGDFTEFGFVDDVGLLIDRLFPKAWLEGSSGYGITSIDDLTPEERNRLDDLINEERSYVPAFAADIVNNSKANGGKLSPLLERVNGWAARYDMVRETGARMASADLPREWVLGMTEKHCDSCSHYAGMVYRTSTWDKWLTVYNAFPGDPGNNLACHGFNCDCKLEITDKPIKRGKPPAPRGGLKMWWKRIRYALSA